jgi:hypothetical protein
VYEVEMVKAAEHLAGHRYRDATLWFNHTGRQRLHDVSFMLVKAA